MPKGKYTKTSDEDIFKLWIELKSYMKVRARLAQMGDVSPKTGVPITASNVTQASHRWMVEHIPEAKASVEKNFYGGKFIPDESWNKYIVKLAMNTYDTSWERQRDWIKRKGMEKYEDLWKRFSPTGTLD